MSPPHVGDEIALAKGQGAAFSLLVVVGVNVSAQGPFSDERRFEHVPNRATLVQKCQHSLFIVRAEPIPHCANYCLNGGVILGRPDHKHIIATVGRRDT